MRYQFIGHMGKTDTLHGQIGVAATETHSEDNKPFTVSAAAHCQANNYEGVRSSSEL